MELERTAPDAHATAQVRISLGLEGFEGAMSFVKSSQWVHGRSRVDSELKMQASRVDASATMTRAHFVAQCLGSTSETLSLLIFREHPPS